MDVLAAATTPVTLVVLVAGAADAVTGARNAVALAITASRSINLTMAQLARYPIAASVSDAVECPPRDSEHFLSPGVGIRLVIATPQSVRRRTEPELGRSAT